MKKYSKETQEKVSQLRLIDDALFRVMAKHKKVLEEILRVLLNDSKLEIIGDTIPQCSVKSFAREVVLDVLCRLGDGSYCNVEVQKGASNNDIRRVRFHASAITADKTPAGTEFANVPDVKVIYITEYDAMKNNQAITPIKRCQIVGDKYLPVDDGEIIYMASTAVKDGTKQSELLQLFLEKEIDNADYPETSRQMQYYKKGKGVNDMCAIVEDYALDKVKKVAQKMIQRGDSNEEIQEVTDLSIEEIEALRSKI
jgi:predicted transposase/invertase (TIGR01784 family)